MKTDILLENMQAHQNHCNFYIT